MASSEGRERIERVAAAIDAAAMGGLDAYRNEREDGLEPLARAAIEAMRGCRDLPAGEGEPGQPAPPEKQLKEVEARLRVAVEALRELTDAVRDYVLSRGAIDYEPGSDPESWDVMQAKRTKAVKVLASLSDRDEP